MIFLYSGRLPVLETFHTWHTLHSHYSLKMKILRYKTSIAYHRVRTREDSLISTVLSILRNTHRKQKYSYCNILNKRNPIWSPPLALLLRILLWRLQLIHLPFNLLYSNWEALYPNLFSPVKNIHFERCKACQHLGYVLILCKW